MENTDNLEKLDLKLLAGLPINIKGIGNVRQLKLKEIALLGEDNYSKALNMLCFDIEDLELEKEIEGLDTFDVVVSNCLISEDHAREMEGFLNLFFDEEVHFVKEYGIFYINELEEERLIYKDNYNLVKKTIMISNCLRPPKKKEKIEPGNERAREFMEKLKELKKDAPKANKDDINLYSIISGVAWKSHIGINGVWDLTVYQLYDAYHRLEIVDNHDKTLNGVYAGTIDAKGLDIRKINWCKNIVLD